MNKITRIKQLVEILNPASYAYYVEDKPIMTDKEYDKLYTELENLEKETNYILSSSPTQKVQGKVVDYLKKVKHTEPMLSADKSKDINDVIKFMGNQECVLSWKLDGLTIVLRYNNGELQQAITRGGGEEGEDVTHTVKVFVNIPLTINYKGYLEIRGEGLVTFKDFERINAELIAKGEETYSSPRNLAAGSVRQLNANITKDRNLIFIAFGIVKCDLNLLTKVKQFDFLYDNGFEVVEHDLTDKNDLEKQIEYFQSKLSKLPFLTDGLIIEFNDIVYGKSQGFTGHHSKSLYALKWQDDCSETTFRDIELNTTRTGMVSITGLFDETEIDGVKVSRASLHNYDIFEKLQLGVGDKITVYRANGVIPQVEDNLTRSNTYKMEMVCPSCGNNIVIKTPQKARFLFCENNNCPSRFIDSLTHFVNKKALNIEGLSEATIEKFVNKGFIKSYVDIFKLEKYKKEIVNMSGFGKKSYNNLIIAINRARNVKLYKLIYGLGIKLIGEGSSKKLCKYFSNDIKNIVKVKYRDLLQIEDFGEEKADSVYKYFSDAKNLIMLNDLLYEVNIEQEDKKDGRTKDLSGKTFVITGTLSRPRDDFKKIIEDANGKVTGSVSNKTNYLLAGANVGATKIRKAEQCGTQVISEDEFWEMIGG